MSYIICVLLGYTVGIVTGVVYQSVLGWRFVVGFALVGMLALAFRALLRLY